MGGSRPAAAGARAALLVLAVLAAGPASAVPAGAPASGVWIERDGAGRVTVRAAGVPLAEVLARLGAATGVSIEPLAPAFGREPVIVEAGPAPVERLVRQLVRPHGLALVYAPRAPRVRMIVVPAGEGEGQAPPGSARPARADGGAEPARVDGAWWRLEDLGPEAAPEAREAAVLTLGGALDDPAAVALLEAVARGDAGLGPDDPARRLARRVLAVRPGSTEEDDDEAD